MSGLNKIFIAVICLLLIVICVLVVRAAPDNVGFVNNCLRIGEGADEDCDVVTMNVTGEPTIAWDESEDSFTITHPVAITGIADGGLTNYDLKVGDTDDTPTYGMMQIGDAVIGRSSFNNGTTMDADGTLILGNNSSPATGKIEVLFFQGNQIRFAIASAGVGYATYNPRSWLNIGPAPIPPNTNVVDLAYWQNLGWFHNIDCDTAGTGADVGIQDDLEVEGAIYTDEINESTPGVGVAFDSMVIPSGTSPAPDVVGAIFLDTDESANGSLMIYNGAWRKVADL